MEFEVFGFRTDIDPTLIDEPPDDVRRQLREYERGDRRQFEVSVTIPPGFVGEVMAEMCAIPYGETRTYGDLADRLDTAAVAVGGACGRNPIGVVVPCHRVVGADSIGGYSAPGGVALKRALLEHEGSIPRG